MRQPISGAITLQRVKIASESQQLQPQIIAILQAEESANVKCIHQYRKLAVASAHGEEETIYTENGEQCMQGYVRKAT